MREVDAHVAQILAIADELIEGELGYDEVCAIGRDGTGRDGDPRFPYTWNSLTEAEKDKLRAYWLAGNEE